MIPNFDQDVKSFEGKVSWALDIRWEGDAPDQIGGMLTYMACDDSKCIFPPDVEFQLVSSEALTPPTSDPLSRWRFGRGERRRWW